MLKRAGVSRRTVLQTAAVAGLARPAIAADPIKIGLPVAMTGTTAGIGAQMRRACEFWAKQVNAKGGLLGRPIELDHRGHRRKSRHRRPQGAGNGGA